MFELTPQNAKQAKVLLHIYKKNFFGQLGR